MRNLPELFQQILLMRSYVPQLEGQAAQFRAMIAENPDETVFHAELAQTYMAMGDLRSANSAYADLIEVCERTGDSYDWHILITLAKNYEQLKEPSTAMNYLRKYLEVVPNAAGAARKLKELEAGSP